MMQSKRLRVFTDRYPWLGPLLWGLSLQYYLVQVYAASRWTTPFSLAQNTISDLANTVCGSFDMRYVCSPAHTLMNASFILFGLTMLFGTGLIYHEFQPSRGRAFGFSCLVLSAIGTALVGIFPENASITLHYASAALPFLIGNLGVLVLGLHLDLGPKMKLYTIASGLIPLLALPFFISKIYFGLGQGGLERVIAYPQTTWLIFFGAYIMMSHYRSVKTK